MAIPSHQADVSQVDGGSPAVAANGQAASSAAARPFTRAAVAVAVAWGCGTSLAVPAAAALPNQSVAVAWYVSLGSGLVAAAALVPGLRWQSRRAVAGDAASWDHLAGLLSIAAIRLLGTVALFGLCRYQMAAASAESIAVWVLAWYVWLTAVEVAAVARELNRPRPVSVRGEASASAAKHRNTSGASRQEFVPRSVCISASQDHRRK